MMIKDIEWLEEMIGVVLLLFFRRRIDPLRPRAASKKRNRLERE